MSVTINVIKLDKRFDGWERFSHRAEFFAGHMRDRATAARAWICARNWLWQTFGPSAELNLAYKDLFGGEQPYWAWHSDRQCMYLRDDALTAFLMKKPVLEGEQFGKVDG